MSDAEDGDDPSGIVGWVKWFWTTDREAVLYVRDVVTSVGAVLAVGLLLFAVSGIWPPMVAVESGSMEPNMQRGDLVFVVSEERFVPEAAPTHDGESTGVIPADRAAEVGHSEFNRRGDVIIYRPDGSARRTPVIHRAMLWVEEGEDWYDRADPDAVGNANGCESLRFCPAPHAGFITKGDNDATNANYDQVTSLSAPVRPSWVVGTAELRVPYLGNIRLLFSRLSPAAVDPPASEALLSTVTATHGGESTGVIPADRAEEIGHEEFNRHGDVIVYRPDGDGRETPIIHRAMLWVEEGENWYDRADHDAIGSRDDCQQLPNCPAPNAGFITLGDNNQNYDQVSRLQGCRDFCDPVHPEWVVGTAELKIPYLGNIRLLFSRLSPAAADAPTANPPASSIAASPAHGTAAAPQAGPAPAA